jgi:retron-type reverse transcriptase
VLTPIFDPHFSEHSYGYRPGRRAHDAVRQARGYVREGASWIVDLDLDRFFDRVNHDMLMARVARRVQDKRVLKLLRAYLNAGVMVNGPCWRTSSWMTWIGNWSDGDTASSATRTTVTFTSGPNGRGSGCWKA